MNALQRIGCAALLAAGLASPAHAYVVTLEQVGSDVVASGSGPIDLTGLSYAFASYSGSSYVWAAGAQIVTGSNNNTDIYSGISGPTNFGGGPQVNADSGSGDVAGIAGDYALIALPSGYTSGAPLSDSATYLNQTFISLGVTPGTYEWTWGTGVNQNFTLIIGTTPLPATLPLFAGGLGAIGVVGWRRKRKAAPAA